MQVAIKSGISGTVAAFLAFGQVAAADDWAQDPANVSEAYPPAVHELTFFKTPNKMSSPFSTGCAVTPGTTCASIPRQFQWLAIAWAGIWRCPR